MTENLTRINEEKASLFRNLRKENGRNNKLSKTKSDTKLKFESEAGSLENFMRKKGFNASD